MNASVSTRLMMSSLSLLYSARLFAQQPEQPAPSATQWGWYGPGHMWGSGWGFWWVMPLMMLFFFLICILVFGFVLSHRWSRGHSWGPPWHLRDAPWSHWRDPTHSALQILNERYAKGEIDKAEYEERKSTILSGSGR